MNALVKWCVKKLEKRYNRPEYEQALDTPLHSIFYTTLLIIVGIYTILKIRR